MIRRRIHRHNAVTWATRDFIQEFVWTAPSLVCLRERLAEVVKDNVLWEELGKFEESNKVLDRKLMKFIRSRKK